MDTINNREKDKTKTGLKIAIIILVILIVIPLGITGLVYRNHKGFQTNVNEMLSKFPGSVGDHFRNYPTEFERIEKVEYLSTYFLDLEPSVAVDKIYIIKKEDERLYTDIIKAMNYISGSKTEDIVVKVRNIELRKDLLFSIYEEAQEDEKEQFLQEVSRIEKQDIIITLKEIEKSFSNRDFLKTLKELKTEKLVEILYYTENDYKDYILNTFSRDERNIIEGLIYEKENEANILIEIAKLYETKPIDVAVAAIGNTENYSMERLGLIYKNLSTFKAAEILSNIKDEKFIEELFSSIMRENKLRNFDTNITADINKTMEFINEYNSKIKDLVIIYEKMAPKNVADIVERMMSNTDIITSLELSSEEVIELSDRIIILDVLSKMKNQALSKVLDFMEPNIASQVTRLLARPN